MQTLDSLKAGDKGKVAKLGGPSDVRRRLMEMGLTPGTPVQVIRFAPLGDPIDIQVRGYHLSLRKDEARQISLQ